MIRALLLLPALLFVIIRAHGQNLALADSLNRELEKATNAKNRITILGQLATLHMNIDNEKAEAYAKEQMRTAELSRDRKLILLALLSHANRHFDSGNMRENAEKGKEYATKALELARKGGLEEFVAWSDIMMARAARLEGQKDKALNYGNLAVSIASTVDSDSLKVAAFNSLARSYHTRNEKLLAFRNYLQALNIAEVSGKYEQLRDCYYNMASFYEDLGEFEKAKDYLFDVHSLTVERNRRWDRLELYIAIGLIYVKTKQYDFAINFYDKCMALADSLDFSIYKLNVYARLFDLYFTSNQPEKALQLVNEKTELKSFMANAGFAMYINHAYALAYTALGKFDSAKYYYTLAEPEFEKRANFYNQWYFYGNYAYYFRQTGNHRKSLEYWLKVYQLGESHKDITILHQACSQLDSVYQRLGDYKNAYHYHRRSIHFKDSLDNLAAERDLLALEVDNENKRQAREAELAEIAKRERHHIQYMGITTAIAAVFIVLVMLGIFSVSRATIRILGFFAFIFLFEFIILLADHQIHDWTHGEPWKILTIKIALISVLLPLHHYLEKKVIAYLTSRKLLTVNPKELLTKLSARPETETVH